jgi:hypothetical protein
VKAHEIDVSRYHYGFWIDDAGNIVPVHDDAGHSETRRRLWPQLEGYQDAAKAGFVHVTAASYREWSADFDPRYITKAALRALTDLIAVYSGAARRFLILAQDCETWNSTSIADGEAREAIRAVRQVIAEKFTTRIVEAA